jgi:hypothetical protein
MIRAIIDTNVLVSALISPSGNEALLLLSVKQGLARAALLFSCYAGGIFRGSCAAQVCFFPG